MNSSPSDNVTGSEIAIVGLAGRFPGARCIEEFWQNLRDGVESIRFFTDEQLRAAGIGEDSINDPNYVRAAAVLDDVEMFDAALFGYSPLEAEITDPQQRLFLECAWESLENAGYDSEKYKGRIGVFAGVAISTYLINIFNSPEVREAADLFQILIANDKDHVPTRVSYKLNLKGPSVNVQTACSTSLVAVHLAAQSLLSGEADMALAGGVSVHVPQGTGYRYQEGGPHSPDGHCRAFDARARGTVGGSGVGIVVLKRLADALRDGDTIHAVIKGSAINNDGARKVGYTAPSIEGQAIVIRAAEIVAEVEPETIGYIEAHGTGTELGDPIEVAALTQAFRARTDKKTFCAIGSVKTNIGHVDAAAGVAGLIKTVLSLENRIIPPSLHFAEPNPKIDFANSPFYVAERLMDWKANGHPRRAGVSSFGIGGTNAHVIVEEFREGATQASARPWQTLLISARTETALESATANLLDHLTKHPELNLADVAYTLQVGRKHFSHRRMVVCSDVADAVTALAARNYQDGFNNYQEAENRPVVFMLPGGGNQYLNMGAELYRCEPIFREEIDTCSEILLRRAGYDLRGLLYPTPERTATATEKLNQTSFALPAIFATEYALAKLLMSCGVHPQIIIGHSLGEYVAACLSGVLSLDDALGLIELRAKLLKKLPGGAMLSISLPEQEVRALLGHQVSLAAINGPSNCVVSGSLDAIAEAADKLSQREVEYRQLLIDVAGHSAAVTPILDELTRFARQLKLNQPTVPYLSNVTGTWITAEECADPTYWARHLRQTVRFAEGVSELLKHPDLLLLEVGPGQTLSSLVKLQIDEERQESVLSTMHHPLNPQSDLAFFRTALGKLWLMGVKVDWTRLYDNEERRRVPLPTYPFERKRYWIDAPLPNNYPPPGARLSTAAVGEPFSLAGARENLEPRTGVKAKHARPGLRQSYLAPNGKVERMIADIWQDLFNLEPVGIHDNFFELGGSSLLAIRLNTKLLATFAVKLTLHAILTAPTVAQLAELIQTSLPTVGPLAPKTYHKPPSMLVEIKAGEPTHPLVLLPPLGGGLFGYHDLTQALDANQAVYGIQPVALDEDLPAFKSIEEEAAHCVEALRALPIAGPYFLGGASYGGAVAFEIAQQLRTQHEEVAFLALLDTPSPSEINGESLDDAQLLIIVLSIIFRGDSVPVSAAELRRLGSEEQIDYVLERVRSSGKLPPDVEAFQARQILRLWKSNAKAMWSYLPQAYAGPMSYFRARERIRGQSAFPELPWIELAAGGIEIQIVPGDHYSMLTPPHVQVLAQKLRRSMNRAMLTTAP